MPDGSELLDALKGDREVPPPRNGVLDSETIRRLDGFFCGLVIGGCVAVLVGAWFGLGGFQQAGGVLLGRWRSCVGGVEACGVSVRGVCAAVLHLVWRT